MGHGMLLAVEVGNTNTTFGLFSDSGELASSYRLSTERERMPDEWFALLAANAAQLFNVELQMPEHVIGRNTADQLRAGIVTGHLALVEGMIERTRAELGSKATVIVTGGLAPLFAGRSPLFDRYDPDLTLNGLKIIYDRVRGEDGAG